jgi:hypothetical protein
MGTADEWERAEAALTAALRASGRPWKVGAASAMTRGITRGIAAAMTWGSTSVAGACISDDYQ